MYNQPHDLQGKEFDDLGIEEAAVLVDGKAAKLAARGGSKKRQGASGGNQWKADGFQAFSVQRKKELKSSGDKSRESDLAAKLANEWLDLSDKVQEGFVKADNESKGKTAEEREPSSSSAEKSESAPKTLTGYQIFCKERRQELKATGQSKDMKPTDVMKLMGAEWQAQSDQQKQDFREKAQQL